MAGGIMTGSQGHNGRGRRNAYRPMSDINVTPMVDVMLVLLIVFMVAAPLLTVGVPVDLPQTQAPAINEQKEPLVITVNNEGKIYLQETEIADDALVPRLKAINYGRVLEIMGLVGSAGFTKVSLIAEMPRDKRQVRR